MAFDFDFGTDDLFGLADPSDPQGRRRRTFGVSIPRPGPGGTPPIFAGPAYTPKSPIAAPTPPPAAPGLPGQEANIPGLAAAGPDAARDAATGQLAEPNPASYRGPTGFKGVADRAARYFIPGYNEIFPSKQAQYAGDEAQWQNLAARGGAQIQAEQAPPKTVESGGVAYEYHPEKKGQEGEFTPIGAPKAEKPEGLTQEEADAVEELVAKGVPRVEAIGQVRSAGTAGAGVKSAFELWQKDHPNGTFEQYQADVAKTTPKESTLKPEIISQIGAQPDPKKYPLGENDPKYKTDSQKWGKDYEAALEREAAAGGESRGKAYGRNRPVEVLDTWNGNRPIRVSAGEQEDNPDRYINQSGGTKALGQTYTMSDIQGAVTNVRNAASVLDNGLTHRAAVAAVLANPQATAANFAQSEVASALTPQEQDYVIAVLTAREVIAGGLRGLLGTSPNTEQRAQAMLATLPGAQTPNSAYAKKQLDSILATLTRIKPAIPNVGPEGRGAPPAAATGGAAPKTAAEYLQKHGIGP